MQRKRKENKGVQQEWTRKQQNPSLPSAEREHYITFVWPIPVPHCSMHVARCERKQREHTSKRYIYVIAYLIMITYSLMSAVVIDANIFMRGIIHLCCKCRSHSFCIDSHSISTFSPNHHFHSDWSHWHDIKYLKCIDLGHQDTTASCSLYYIARYISYLRISKL